MKKYRFHVKAAMLGTLLLTFPACEGLFDDIYDNPSEANLSTNGFGFVEVSPETHSDTPSFVHILKLDKIQSLQII